MGADSALAEDDSHLAKGVNSLRSAPTTTTEVAL